MQTRQPLSYYTVSSLDNLRALLIGLLFALLIFSSIFGLEAQAAPQSTSVSSRSAAATSASIGRWTVRFTNGGLQAEWDGIPVLRGGNLQLFTPSGRGLYGAGANPPTARVETLPDGGQVYSVHYRYQMPLEAAPPREKTASVSSNTNLDTNKNAVLDAAQRIEIHLDNTITFAITATWSGPEPALLEWNPLRVWAYALVGAEYSSQTANGELVTGHIGLKPRSGALAVTSLSPGWNRLLLRHTAIGDITLTTPESGKDTAGTNAADTPLLYDGREDENLRSERVFWGGYNGTKLLPNRETSRSIMLTVTPRHAVASAFSAGNAAQSMPVALPARLQKQTIAADAPLRDADGHPLLVPRPQQTRFFAGDFRLSRTLTVCAVPARSDEFGDLLIKPTGADVGSRVRADLRRLGEELHAQTGTTLRFTPSSDSVNLRVCLLPAPASTPAAHDRTEEYRLIVRPGNITLMGYSEAGLFYGLQTLRQLLVAKPNHRYAFVCADIRDWPALKFRGAHIFTGRDALPFHKKMIERLFARFKMNALVIECEYTDWKSHPEIHAPNSMSPNALRADVAFARAHFLEPIPLVNSLGHSQWMFANGQHLDLAEDPQKPYAYDASNAATYAFLFDIYRETLDIFHPRYFHIGHDEVKIPGDDVFGRYPARPENIRKGITRLFVDDTNKLADWLRARNVRTMLWGDMLLHESEGVPSSQNSALTAANAQSLTEAQERRALLPKDAIIADWRYGAGSEQRNGLQTLRQAGFDTLGCAWYEPDNIRGWAQQAVQNHALGTLQTTWAGYDSNERLLDTEYKQFTAYVLAAEAAWTGGAKAEETKGKAEGREQKAEEMREASAIQNPKTKIKALRPLPAADVFARAYRNAGVEKTQRGWKLDLRQSANAQIASGNDMGKQGAFPLRPYIPASLSKPASGSLPAGILLRSVLPLLPVANTSPDVLPVAVSFSIKARAGTLLFDHATVCGVENGALVATYTIVYADGKRVQIPLRYGFQIRALDDTTPSDSFSTSAMTLLGSDVPMSYRRLHWTNPRPGVPIERLELRTDNLVAAPLLFGVAGIE